MTEHYYTSISRPDPLRINHLVVTVFGPNGKGTFVRNNWISAEKTAAKYARLFGAPNQIFGR